MKRLCILIVEDEGLIAMDLEDTIHEIVNAVTIVRASVAGTKQVLDRSIDFAFLDVDVTNGKTFEVGMILTRKRIPFAFVSSSKPGELPVELRNARFIPKPFSREQIARALRDELSD